jgi:Ca2+-transporting ATPase
MNQTYESQFAKAEKPSTPWHALPVSEVSAALGTDPETGLDEATARQRLGQYGPNKLQVTKRVRWYQILARQFVDVLITILLIAAAISFAIGETGDAMTIMAIVVLNGILGFVQEWKAEQAMAALQRMLAPICTVVREGSEQKIEARRLVPGDLVLLSIGDRVPADLRLIAATNLKIDESALTGESVSVRKDVKPGAEDTPLASRSCAAWMGTAVTNGRARGLVVATGMQTEFGRIARLTQTVGEEATPLQRKLAVLGRQLGIFSVGISILVALSGWLLGKPLLEMFLTGVSLAVAVVPEGLPAVVTISLALGIRAMVRRNALLRRLQAAEALGAASIVCTDKTGTLTQNEMTVKRIWLPGGAVEVTGVGYDPAGHFEAAGKKIDYHGRPDLLALLHTGLVCNHARVYRDEQGWHEAGEPTEAALLVAAYKAWLEPEETQHTLSEFSFNSNRKRMTVIEHLPEGLLADVKGAPEVIVARCSQILIGDQVHPLSETDKKQAIAAYTTMAEQGLRTLAMARRKLPEKINLDEDAVECELTLLGIVGIIDPPRPEVRQAIRVARQAGLRPIMITGDAAPTAQAIAQRIGMPVTRTITGAELDQMNEEDLRGALQQEVVFARTRPEHKLRIVSLLQQMGHVVAMTGDGVNDAPALKKADIGIAMGLRGTDVAKGASDIVLVDDNFASIIGAVEEGRRQYDNIQKFVRYLLSSNTGEVIAIFVNILVGGPLILLPVQILWMNLVTDGMTAVALGMEPVEKGVMERPPHSPRDPILNRTGMLVILILGSYIGGGALWLFHHYLQSGQENAVAMAQTVAFTGIILLEKMNVFNFRTLREPIKAIGFFSNPWVLLAWSLTIGLQVCAVYVPFLQELLHTVPLGWEEWGIIFAAALPVFLLMETYKWLQWRQHQS